MAKYRKKPVVIEAEQWEGPWSDIKGVKMKSLGGDSKSISGEKVKFYIETLEGEMTVCRGDWIITGVKGEKYPCKPDIFEAT